MACGVVHMYTHISTYICTIDSGCYCCTFEEISPLRTCGALNNCLLCRIVIITVLCDTTLPSNKWKYTMIHIYIHTVRAPAQTI